MAKSDIHVQIVYGWFGKNALDALQSVATKIRQAGYTVHDNIMWSQPQLLAKTLDSYSHPKAIIGFSMGASCIPLVGRLAKKSIDLAVAYDPSVWAPEHDANIGGVLHLGFPREVPAGIKRLLLYRVGWGTSPYGHAIFTGPQVERTEVWGEHVLIPLRRDLADKTLSALAQL